MGEVVAAVESDIALVIAVLRLANQAEGRTRGKVASVVQAVEVLTPEGVSALAQGTQVFDFFERGGVWEGAPERFRLHGVATQRAADRLAREAGYDERDRLLVTALLHDVGKLVLMHAYPGYPGQVHGSARTPEERIHRERRELGVDHALVGGVLVRRWGLPKSLASAIERHHSDEAEGEAAFVRLADMLAHYSQGFAITPSELLKTARRVGLDLDQLRTVMYDLPFPSADRQRQVEPCPLSGARGRGAQAPGPGQGLQADRPRARALHEHRAHAPAQHLRQARRRGSRPGRPRGDRARLDRLARPQRAPARASGQPPRDRDAGGVDEHVRGRAVAAVHEGLVVLVGAV